MGVVLYLYVCPFVSERIERKLYLYETPMYFSYFVYFMYILSYIMLFGSHFVLVFQFW